MTSDEHKKSATHHITYLLGQHFKKDKRLQTSIKFKTKVRKNYLISTTNIFPKDIEIIPKIIEEIQDQLLGYGKELDNGANEIIIRKTESGAIYDQGQKYFEILNGFSLEIYGYKSESLIFFRVTHERQMSNEKEWISIDIDEVKESLWFQD